MNKDLEKMFKKVIDNCTTQGLDKDHVDDNLPVSRLEQDALEIVLDSVAHLKKMHLEGLLEFVTSGRDESTDIENRLVYMMYLDRMEDFLKAAEMLKHVHSYRTMLKEMCEEHSISYEQAEKNRYSHLIGDLLAKIKG